MPGRYDTGQAKSGAKDESLYPSALGYLLYEGSTEGSGPSDLVEGPPFSYDQDVLDFACRAAGPQIIFSAATSLVSRASSSILRPCRGLPDALVRVFQNLVDEIWLDARSTAGPVLKTAFGHHGPWLDLVVLRGLGGHPALALDRRGPDEASGHRWRAIGTLESSWPSPDDDLRGNPRCRAVASVAWTNPRERPLLTVRLGLSRGLWPGDCKGSDHHATFVESRTVGRFLNIYCGLSASPTLLDDLGQAGLFCPHDKVAEAILVSHFELAVIDADEYVVEGAEKIAAPLVGALCRSLWASWIRRFEDLRPTIKGSSGTSTSGVRSATRGLPSGVGVRFSFSYERDIVQVSGLERDLFEMDVSRVNVRLERNRCGSPRKP